MLICHFLLKYKNKIKLSTLEAEIISNKVNLQPQFMNNLLLVAHIVILMSFINLVWYMVALAQIVHNPTLT